MSKTFQLNVLSAKFIVLLMCTLLCVGTVKAFTELNQAQTLIYDTAHLKSTKQGQVLIYRFEAQESDQAPVKDRVELLVQNAHDDGSRDVVVDFLSDERHIAFPDFTGFNGNPVIISMLEHIAQKMGRETGGGALYFRNRMRDALAGDVKISHSKAMLGNKEVGTTVLTFEPFLDDQYIRGFPEYVNSKFSITFSEFVSGGLIGVKIISADAKQHYFTEEILLLPKD